MLSCFACLFACVGIVGTLLVGRLLRGRASGVDGLLVRRVGVD